MLVFDVCKSQARLRMNPAYFILLCVIPILQNSFSLTLNRWIKFDFITTGTATECSYSSNIMIVYILVTSLVIKITFLDTTRESVGFFWGGGINSNVFLIYEFSVFVQLSLKLITSGAYIFRWCATRRNNQSVRWKFFGSCTSI